MPIPEDHPQRPISPYGDSKLAFERPMAWFHVAYGLRYLSLRYFNAAGVDVDGEFGEAHDPETHIILLVLDAARGRRPKVRIFVTDYATEDGTCYRDYIHVNDLAQAYVAALDRLMTGHCECQVINLGTGRAFSVRQVIDMVRRVTGCSFEAEECARRRGIRPILWRPRTGPSDCSNGSRRTVGWRKLSAPPGYGC